MSEVVLKTIVEKLEAIELLLKVTDPGKEKGPDMAPIKQELEGLKREIKALPFLVLQSLQGKESGGKSTINRIEHKHHLHKGIWIVIGLFIICFVLTWRWLSSYKTSQVLKANDIKYRYLKINGNTALLNFCKSTDSLYRKDEDGFRAKVELDEQYLIDQATLLRFAGEKEKRRRIIK